MKILYGIQGTGNGHISRAREMAKALAQRNISVDYMFSGRPADQYFDMEAFGNYRTYKGLTFASKNGRLSYTRTALSNNLFQFVKDIRSIDTKQYDLVITDFEPILAWACKTQGVKAIGLGHQYAFGHKIPRAGDNFVSDLTMKLFAPVELGIGLHWSSFGAPILPPIINTELTHERDKNSAQEASYDAIVVYLPFENQQKIQDELKKISSQRFIIYSPELSDSEDDNLSLRKTSHHRFKHDLCRSKGVISNSGFELISECLHLGLSILTKPQYAQTEQMSNAAALKELGYATTVETITHDIVASWLAQLKPKAPLKLPNVTEAVCDWIIGGQTKSIQALSEELWAATAC